MGGHTAPFTTTSVYTTQKGFLAVRCRSTEWMDRRPLLQPDGGFLLGPGREYFLPGPRAKVVYSASSCRILALQTVWSTEKWEREYACVREMCHNYQLVKGSSNTDERVRCDGKRSTSACGRRDRYTVDGGKARWGEFVCPFNVWSGHGWFWLPSSYLGLDRLLVDVVSACSRLVPALTAHGPSVSPGPCRHSQKKNAQKK